MKQQQIRRTVLAGLAAAGLALAGSASANAATIASTNIGSWSSSILENTWASSPLLGHDSSLTVTAYFADHTSTSVRLTSFRICYNSGPATAITIAPYTRNSGGNTWGDTIPYKSVTRGTCQTWSPNKTYYKQADNEVVRVVSRINTATETIAAWYR